MSKLQAAASHAKTDPVDLSNCAREPIHIIGNIQPFGCLFAFSLDWTLVHVSQNAAQYTGRSPDTLLGQDAAAILDGGAMDAIRLRLQQCQALEVVERIFGIDLFGDGEVYDAAVHLSDRLVVLEFEPAAPESELDAMAMARSMITNLRAATTLQGFFDQAARNVRAITGFDRVKVYRFSDDGSGEVIAEATNGKAESYLGLRFPESDIPAQARALYLKNIFRIIPDVQAEGVPIVPSVSPEGMPLDLSFSVLRAVSPMHIEYLRNMGVGASLSISIVVDGKLWGLLACHHMSPKLVPFQRRTLAELFAELFSLEVSNRNRAWLIEVESAAHQLHDRILSTMSVDVTAFANLADNLPDFQQLIACDGCGVWVDGQYAHTGRGLNEEEARGLVAFLNTTGASRVYATNELSRHLPAAEAYATRVAGVLAIPVSRRPRDYLIFYRSEIVQFVNWAGNPDKPMETGPNGSRLIPRTSFDIWRTMVNHTSARWLPFELASAESLRTTLLEVILRSIDQTHAVQRKAEETQNLLIGELNHRVRNILTLIVAIIQRTNERARTVDEFADLLGGRVRALARAHDQLTRDHWSPAPIRTLVENECHAFADTAAGRVRLNGPHIDLAPEAYTSIALVLHELFTNSLKHGALSVQQGELEVEWLVDDTGSLVVSWAESGGPAVRAPSREGFGRSVIERAIPSELGGDASLEFRLTGVCARFVIPGCFVLEAAGAEGPPTPAPHPQLAEVPAIADSSVLLVEDNAIIAMAGEDLLHEAGFGAVIVAGRTPDAVARVEAGGVDYAVLDINLGSTTSMPVAEALGERGIPFIFASGYGDPNLLPEAFRSVPVVTKPYSKDAIMAGLFAAAAEQRRT